MEQKQVIVIAAAVVAVALLYAAFVSTQGTLRGSSAYQSAFGLLGQDSSAAAVDPPVSDVPADASPGSVDSGTGAVEQSSEAGAASSAGGEGNPPSTRSCPWWLWCPKLPDFISRISPRSQTAFVGQTIPLTITTINSGAAPGAASVTTLSFGGTTQYYKVPALAVFQQYTVHALGNTFTCSQEGTFTITSTANYNHRVTESNYANNKDSIAITCASVNTTTTTSSTTTSSIATTSSSTTTQSTSSSSSSSSTTTTSSSTTTQSNGTNSTLPDLVTAFNQTNFSVSVGKAFNVTVNTTNIGAAPAGASTTNIYGNATSLLSAPGLASIPGLGAGQAFQTNSTLNCTQAGTYNLTASANWFNTVVESNYLNNNATAEVICS